jgi:fructose-1,6-bisphosphatase-3
VDPEFAYVIEELMTVRSDDVDQEAYYNEIIHSVITTGRARELITAFAKLIRRLTVDHLHVVGDIFDRGPSPHLIMDALMQHHSVDVQWGNHDVLWMGAAAGNKASICNVIRIAAKYGNLPTLEEGYGINLLPLAKLAMEYYAKDPCTCFVTKESDSEYALANHLRLDTTLEEKMHKAITILQFKLEGQLIMSNPEFAMENRLFLDKIDLQQGTVRIGETTYPLSDTYFPTLLPEAPYQLTPAEAEVMDQLQLSFTNCEKLQEHVRFLYSHGSLYKVYNGNLLYHGCVPLTEDGDFLPVRVFGKEYCGRRLYDVLEAYARAGYYATDPVEKEKGIAILWFLWENPSSPVFGKEKMTVFERYFVKDTSTHAEPKNAYYRLLEKEEVVDKILEEFGLSGDEAHIINGHIPVEAKAGESPMKCNGKLLIIDGGLSKAYQPKTGIAGYTLIYNSHGLFLAAHEPFTSVADAVEKGSDIHSERVVVQQMQDRKRVADTDNGREIAATIADLQGLLEAYRCGSLKEQR